MARRQTQAHGLGWSFLPQTQASFRRLLCTHQPRSVLDFGGKRSQGSCPSRNSWSHRGGPPRSTTSSNTWHKRGSEGIISILGVVEAIKAGFLEKVVFGNLKDDPLARGGAVRPSGLCVGGGGGKARAELE